jgi:hypothetical protein
MDSAPAVAGDALDTGLDMLDPTMMAELGLQAAKIGAKWLPRLFAKEAVPEAAVESGIRSMIPQPRTVAEYFTKPAPDEPVDNNAHWRAVRDVEQRENPQSISRELGRAYQLPSRGMPKLGTAPRF